MKRGANDRASFRLWRGSRQVEQQYFCALKPFDRDLLFVADGGSVALLQLFAIELHCATRYLEPAIAAFSECMRHLLLRFEQRNEQARVLVDSDRAITTVGRSDHAQLAELLLARERLLLVSGLNAVLFREDPDLQQMNGVRLGGVAFAVADAVAGAHALPVAGADD